MPTVTFTTPGAGSWTAPTGISTTVIVQCWGAGGGGADTVSSSSVGGGGGGGEFAQESAATITAGSVYGFTVGTGGGGGVLSNGTAGTNTVFSANSGAITAHGGQGGSTTGTGGLGGTGSTNSVHYNGGSGGTGAFSSNYAGGGGGSAGPSSAGNMGIYPYVGGAAVSGGGGGGNGSYSTPGGIANGSSGGAPGGGGGGQFPGAACVTADTEILTAERGWINYNQVHEGMHAWSVNMDNGNREWTLVVNMRTWHVMHSVYRITGDGYDCVATEAHGHLIKTPSGYEIVKTPELARDDIELVTEHGTVGDFEVTEYGVASPVWCPTTEAGNWLARRNNTEFFTGNKP